MSLVNKIITSANCYVKNTGEDWKIQFAVFLTTGNIDKNYASELSVTEKNKNLKYFLIKSVKLFI